MQGRNLSLIILAGFGLNLALSQASLAEETTFVGPQGQFTTQRDVTRNGNTVTVDRTTTLPDGVKTDYSNTFNRSDNHGFTDSATRTYTRPDGTNSYQMMDQRSYSNGTYQNNYTRTGPNGQFTTQRDVTRNGNTVTIDRTTTLPNGVKTDYSNTFNRSGNHGFTDSATRTYTRPDGTNLYQVRDQRSYGDRAYQDNYTITGPHGRQATFNDTGACHYGQCTRQEQYTNWNGRSRSVNVTSDRIGRRTWEQTETITNRNGQQRTFDFFRRR